MLICGSGYFALHNCLLLARILSSPTIAEASLACRFLRSRAGFWFSYFRLHRILLQNESFDPNSSWNHRFINQPELRRSYASYIVELAMSNYVDALLHSDRDNVQIGNRNVNIIQNSSNTHEFSTCKLNTIASVTGLGASDIFLSSAPSLSKREQESGVMSSDDVLSLQHGGLLYFIYSVVIQYNPHKLYVFLF